MKNAGKVIIKRHRRKYPQMVCAIDEACGEFPHIDLVINGPQAAITWQLAPEHASFIAYMMRNAADRIDEIVRARKFPMFASDQVEGFAKFIEATYFDDPTA
jgi:hypothetical protein